jgi:hypothetical protein
MALNSAAGKLPLKAFPASVLQQQDSRSARVERHTVLMPQCCRERVAVMHKLCTSLLLLPPLLPPPLLPPPLLLLLRAPLAVTMHLKVLLLPLPPSTFHCCHGHEALLAPSTCCQCTARGPAAPASSEREVVSTEA